MCRWSAFVFVLLFPFYWMAITAFKPDAELLDYKNYNPFWIGTPTLAHIQKLLFDTAYPRWLLTTMAVAVGATVARRCSPRVLAAYAIQRLRFRGTQHVGLAIYPRLSGAAVDPVHPAGDHGLPARPVRHAGWR